MAINTNIISYSTHIQAGAFIPMFMPKALEQPMADNAKTQVPVQDQLSLFDVKELYDLAYDEKAKGAEGEEAFKKLLAQAVKLDMAYRRQLAQKTSYKDKKQVNTFSNASGKTRVA